MRVPNSAEDAQKFDALVEILISKFNGKLFYHEIIGILQMHITALTLEAYGLTDDEEEEDDDEMDGEEWKL